jgi:type IV pilus assembly protein PilV
MSALSRYPRSARGQRGVTLVETLVTLVSTSVGLLGVAALHLVSLRTNHDAHLRLQASTLAASVLERIRADRAGYLAGDYADIEFNGAGAAGTPASANLAAWQREIDRQLPGGPDAAAGAVQHDDRSPVVTVTIRWRDNDRADEATPYVTLSMSTEI